MYLYCTSKRTLKYSLRVIKVTSQMSQEAKSNPLSQEGSSHGLFTLDESDSDEEKLAPMTCEAPAAKLRHGLRLLASICTAILITSEQCYCVMNLLFEYVMVSDKSTVLFNPIHSCLQFGSQEQRRADLWGICVIVEY